MATWNVSDVPRSRCGRRRREKISWRIQSRVDPSSGYRIANISEYSATHKIPLFLPSSERRNFRDDLSKVNSISSERRLRRQARALQTSYPLVSVAPRKSFGIIVSPIKRHRASPTLLFSHERGIHKRHTRYWNLWALRAFRFAIASAAQR